MATLESGSKAEARGGAEQPADRALASDEKEGDPRDKGDDGMEENIEEVGPAIERLNEAIDTVNRLEDEHQAWIKLRGDTHAIMKCQIRVLESELPCFDLLKILSEASRAAARALKQQSAAEQNLARLQAKHHELHAQSSVEVMTRADLNSNLLDNKLSLSTAQKAVISARKVVMTANAREEKARRSLQKARDAAGDNVMPMEDELQLLQQTLRHMEEHETRVEEESHVGASMQLAKDNAAAEVRDAMQALEEMSNSMHQSRTATSDHSTTEQPSQPDGQADADPDALNFNYGTSMRKHSDAATSSVIPQNESARASLGTTQTPAASSAVLWNMTRLFQRRGLESSSPPPSTCGSGKHESRRASIDVSDPSFLAFRDLAMLMNECSDSTIETQQL